MADRNTEMLTEEETLEEIDTYHLNDGDYDENEEGTVEYLDLDLEVDSIPESTEVYMPEVAAPKPRVQSSVLKTNNFVAAKPKRKLKRKPTRGKRKTIAATSNIEQTTSSRDISASKYITRAGKRKIDELTEDTVNAGLNAINAKLADSAQSINGRGRNIAENTQNEKNETQNASSNDFQIAQNRTDVKKEYDSLDLFFQSMAQTVLNLPSQVQAKIKMDICQVITMAEIKYCATGPTAAAAADANS